MLGAPGKGWIYCGGATALLGRLIERGAGIDLHTFAKISLFDPLGIYLTEWSRVAMKYRRRRRVSGLRRATLRPLVK